MDEYLTTEEVAALLKCKPGTVRQWRARRVGPLSHIVGRRHLYRRSDVDAWVTANVSVSPRTRSIGRKPR